MSKILIVEDEETIREAMTAYLKTKGYDITQASDGLIGWQAFQKDTFDLVILDVMMPQMNGFEVLQKIREVSQVAVLMLTALSDEKTQIQSFDYEADDYLSKPFSIIILEKRVQALLKRTQQHQDTWVKGSLVVDFLSYSAKDGEKEIDLTTKEIQILQYLVEHENQVLTRDQILDEVWDFDDYPNDRVVDVYIKNLRKKLNLDDIVTVKGVGYKYQRSQE